MTTIKIGTFNLNNLFSRFNFTAAVDDAVVTSKETTVYSFSANTYSLRKYEGKLVHAKPAKDTAVIGARIREMDPDVLAVQEVEDIDTLKEFARDHLGGTYPFVALIEGNDPRLIDVGLLSKLPLGAVTSFQYAVHPDAPNERVFSRDLLEVEVYDRHRRKRLFTLYNTHLKSHYVPWTTSHKTAEKREADRRRTQQAEMIARIIAARARPDSAFVLVGDMNDAVDSACLRPFTRCRALRLVNALKKPRESRAVDGAPTTAWTHRFKEAGKRARYELFDQIWLSPALAVKQREAWIGRRKRLGGDASDHDPAWIALEM